MEGGLHTVHILMWVRHQKHSGPGEGQRRGSVGGATTAPSFMLLFVDVWLWLLIPFLHRLQPFGDIT